MLSRNRIIIGGIVIVAIPVIAIAWWLLSPLFITSTVNEDFPFAANAVIPTGITMQEVDSVMQTMAKVSNEVSEAMPDSMMMQGSTTQMDASVISLKSGDFQDADNFHKGSGTATIYQDTDGSNVLRLENFNVTNGPDLHVILTPHANPEGRDDVSASGYVDLGKIKGNAGNQNYPIPDGVDISSQMTVVIYCQPFHVVFSTASLSDS